MCPLRSRFGSGRPLCGFVRSHSDTVAAVTEFCSIRASFPRKSNSKLTQCRSIDDEVSVVTHIESKIGLVKLSFATKHYLSFYADQCTRPMDFPISLSQFFALSKPFDAVWKSIIACITASRDVVTKGPYCTTFCFRG